MLCAALFCVAVLSYFEVDEFVQHSDDVFRLGGFADEAIRTGIQHR